MSIHTTSTPTLSGATHHRAGRIVLIALGGMVLLTGLVAVGVLVDRWGDSPSATVLAPAIVAPSALNAPMASAVTASGRGHTVYLVGSREQALAVREGINDANAIRFASHETPFLDSVLVVGSDAEAATIAEAISEGNRILASLGEPEDRVVDLRGS